MPVAHHTEYLPRCSAPSKATLGNNMHFARAQHIRVSNMLSVSGLDMVLDSDQKRTYERFVEYPHCYYFLCEMVCEKFKFTQNWTLGYSKICPDSEWKNSLYALSEKLKVFFPSSKQLPQKWNNLIFLILWWNYSVNATGTLAMHDVINLFQHPLQRGPESRSTTLNNRW